MESHSAASRTELERRQRELEILHAVAESLNASVDLCSSLRNALSAVTTLLGLRSGWIWLLDDASGEPYLAAVKDLPEALADFPERMEGGCYCLDRFRQGDLAGALNISVVECTRLKWLTAGTDGLRFHASVPIYAHGRRLGVMNVATTEWRSLSPADLRILHTIGEMLGVAIERAHLYERSAEAGAIEERTRMAREIHDTLAQGFSAIAVNLDGADAILENGGDVAKARELIGRALGVSRLSLEEARRSIQDLRAAPLEGRPLAEALSRLVDDLNSRHSPEITFSIIGTTHPISPRLEAGIFRIAQEALANSLDHADPTHISVEFAALPSEITLMVEDDGRGFDPSEVERGRFGLIGMRERALLLGGRLDIDSNTGNGTKIRVQIPRHL